MAQPTLPPDLLSAVRAARAVLLTGPVGPDGDSIGACLALARAIRQVSAARVDVAGDPSFRYAWMPGAADMRPDETIPDDYDLAVVLDGDQSRLSPRVQQAFARAGLRGIIDHHGTTSPEGYDLPWIDRRAASTCEMVLDLMDAWGVALDGPTAALLYAGMIFDTGGFRYSNTSAATHRRAARLLEQGIDHAAIAVRVLMERRPAGVALNARITGDARYFGGGAVVLGVVSRALLAELDALPGDLEGIVDAMVYVEGVEVAVLVVEQGPDRVKLSLRSRGLVDVAALARSLSPGGGGHAKAAGVTLASSLAAAAATLPGTLVAAVEAARASG